ncbi:tol-pal system protein YbgF [Dasania marina]|uniref:tol-pal system protein YbgF n=1 Tax=Dasania marina TaxID=471499 RepID=UPI0030DC4267|tara:strand:+ start:62774 stop:63553 length:780 start_codon:yes stop_codon:yes gene_type:complete
MPKHAPSKAVLLSSAAFLFMSSAFAQVPVIDASISHQAVPVAATSAQPQMGNAQSQGELFYQLQLLQEEMRMLRGMVEEQGHQLERFKQQSTERYIDVDKRLGSLIANDNAAPEQANSTATVTALNDKPAGVGEKDAYDVAYSLVPKRQYAQAITAFHSFLLDFPDGKYAPNAYYWLGELYLVVKPADLEASRQSFTQLLELYPRHPKEADAMYKLGTVYFLKDNKEKSRLWLEKVVAQYGKGVNSAADKARDFLRDRF